MSKVESVQSLYFSPTGNVRSIVETITRGTKLRRLKPINLTLPKKRDSWNGKVEASLILVGVPVHAGSYPSLLLPYLKKLEGTGRWAVPVAVCGNAQMRTCLPDVSGVLKQQGFKIVAAANFVGQHAFATEELPLAIGRPDGRDLRMAYKFGKKIVDKLRSGSDDISIVRGGNLYLRTYLASAVDSQGSTFPATLRTALRVVELDKSKCSGCLSCVRSCPTNAIDVKSLLINDEACIRCFACTVSCQLGLRGKIVNPDAGLKAWFLHQGSVRAEPQIIL
ncbi:MAG: 4Fe-4S binding protein [Candidatus Bathyarchaeota archaeon]|nr:4Fe-4S binding protein [Candidatus Bathyarchaeota archaeon]